MRRLARRLVALCSTASLVVGVAVCGLWVRSYWLNDSVLSYYFIRGDQDDYEDDLRVSGGAASSRGRIYVGYATRPEAFREGYPSLAWVSTAATGDSNVQVAGSPQSLWQRVGFEWHRKQHRVRTGLTVVFPHWFIALIAGILPAHRLYRQERAARRVARGLCPHCGYDLRATPGRCPECGTAVNGALPNE